MKDFNTNLKKYISKTLNKKKPIFNLSDKSAYLTISKTLADILQANEPNNKEWDFSDNMLQTRLILAWFCNDRSKFDETAAELGDKTLKITKNLYIFGEKGSGKSSTVYAANDLIKNLAPETNNKSKKVFEYVEQNKIINTFEIESNINKYTYNETVGKFDGNPVNIVLDDLKFKGLNQHYGTKLIDVLIRFLYDRYSIWLFGNANTIITSLLTPSELKNKLPDDLSQRFKHQYNLIRFSGSKREK